MRKIINLVREHYYHKSQHYNPKKYWKRRMKIVDPLFKKNYLSKIFWLYYLKKTEGYNCSSMGTNIGSGAIFQSVPVLPHGIKGIIIGHNVVIGKNCTLLQHVTIADGTPECPTVIGDNCFIGAGAVIRSCRKIGKNVVIGANSVVTKDIGDNMVVGGVPAKQITKENN